MQRQDNTDMLDYIKNGIVANYKNSVAKCSIFMAKYDQYPT